MQAWRVDGAVEEVVEFAWGGVVVGAVGCFGGERGAGWGGHGWWVYGRMEGMGMDVVILGFVGLKWIVWGYWETGVMELRMGNYRTSHEYSLFVGLTCRFSATAISASGSLDSFPLFCFIYSVDHDHHHHHHAIVLALMLV